MNNENNELTAEQIALCLPLQAEIRSICLSFSSEAAERMRVLQKQIQAICHPSKKDRSAYNLLQSEGFKD